MFFRRRPAEPVEAMMPQTLQERIEKGQAPVIVDVREDDEWAAGHIAQALHIPLGELPARAQTLNPKDEIVVVCKSGYRSWRAALYLRQLGFERVWNLQGGMDAWG